MKRDGLQISAATAIHKGDRPYQQDQVALLSHPRVKGCLLGVVADGMGGKSGGRKASDQVMLTAQQLFERYDPVHDDATDLLRQMAFEAHTVIRLTAIAAEEEPHSTYAAFIVNPEGDCHWAHLGDSRIYHFHEGALVHRSRDHSYVEMLVQRGEITAAQARDHAKSNLLTGCLGADREPRVDVHHIDRLRAGDVLMACSDGVWHYFNDLELGAALRSLPPREASELIIDRARQRAGGKGDNLSVVILRFDARPVAAPSVSFAR